MTEFELKEVKGPHAGLQVHVLGNTSNPRKAVIFLHGRGSNGANILRAANHLSASADTLFIAPTANGNSWYPNRFILDQRENQPHLSSALDVLRALIDYCEKTYDISPGRIVLAGFSQGACLISEFSASHKGKMKGLCVWSGGLIGSDEDVRTLDRKGDLRGTPVYVGCDEVDAYIPLARVQITAKILESVGADVTCKIYQGLGHAIHRDGYQFLEGLLN